MLNRIFATNLGKAHIDKITVSFIHRFISAAITQISEFRIIEHSLLAGSGLLIVVGGLTSQKVLRAAEIKIYPILTCSFVQLLRCTTGCVE